MNAGDSRVIDELRRSLRQSSVLDLATPKLSIFAFGELAHFLGEIERCRLVAARDVGAANELLGSDNDRAFRNRLSARFLAVQFAKWIEKKVDVRTTHKPLPQSLIAINGSGGGPIITGHCSFTTEGLGLTPGDQFGLIQCSETKEEGAALALWFEQLWTGLPRSPAAREQVLEKLQELAAHKAPSQVYFLMLFHLFSDLRDELDEDKIVKAATGIRDSVVWKKLFKFQRDGVIGAIDKLERHGGCIIADSVGLGKTFEALAVIKYYELRNDRVLVLCPKRLRDNWTLYKSNDRRNSLGADRLHYDVLNHTDLSREAGMSGDIDLTHVNWGNYDLVVIDESHNFRNKSTHKGRETRYDRLMHRIIKSGVKTRVLMLSATPVNNRLADLKNQIAFVTEGNDTALAEHHIPSVEATTRLAQAQFNRWLDLDRGTAQASQAHRHAGFRLLQTA